MEWATTSRNGPAACRADAPPRPGTAKYDEFMKERERKRLEPAVTTNDTAKTNDPTKSNASLDPVH